MGAPQMYYTSCEVGLAGYPGFQFNAATPGVDPVVLRRVEQGTSYEPPRSLGYQPTPEQIAACPVNLCYLPGADGEPAVLANTVFVGTDYSHRFGNYFVHALSLASVEDDLGGVLPIDFWGAGFWARTEAAQVELPALRPVPTDAAGPATTEAFLQGSGRRGWLPQLLTAVERAMVTGERSVVVVEADSARVAGWVAAVCHLLPPAMNRRLSFATYSYRPGRNTEQLIGTVPETEFVVDEAALQGYFLFDFVGGQASAVTAHPLAELLTAMDTQDAADLWSLAEPLSSGAERDFADWYPSAAAGALRGGIPVDAGDLAAVVGWLPGNAARLRPALVSEVAHRCLPHEALTAQQGAVLVEVAGAVGDEDLLEAAETRTFEVLLRELGGNPVAPRDVPRPSTPAGVRLATDLITAALHGAGPDRSVPVLLTVAVRAGLRLDRRDLDRWGRALVTPVLLAGADPDGQLSEALRHLPDLRRAVLETLAAALPGREPAVLAAAARLGDAVPEQELGSYPVLHRAVLLARGGRDPGTRVPTLLRLFPSGVPDQAALTTLWPDEWSVAEAAEVTAAVPPRFWSSPAMVERIDQVLRRPDEPRGAPWSQYYALCESMEKANVVDRLSAAAATHVRDLQQARHLVEQSRTASSRRRRQILLELLDRSQRATGPARRFLESYLPAALLRLDARSLGEVLPAVPEPVRRPYWQQATDALRAKPADLAVAAALLEVRAQQSGKQALTAELDQVLAATVARWRSRDLDQLEKWLGGEGDRGTTAFYRKWRDDNVPRGISRFLSRRRP